MSQNFVRMENLDTRIPLKIVAIECEDSADIVNVHRGDEPRVIGGLSENFVGQNQLLPRGIDIVGLGEKVKQSFDLGDAFGGELRRISKAVGIARARCNNP